MDCWVVIVCIDVQCCKMFFDYFGGWGDVVFVICGEVQCYYVVGKCWDGDGVEVMVFEDVGEIFGGVFDDVGMYRG